MLTTMTKTNTKTNTKTKKREIFMLLCVAIDLRIHQSFAQFTMSSSINVLLFHQVAHVSVINSK